MMRKSRRLVVCATAIGLLTMGGIIAGMDVAHADGSVSCSGSGTDATCTVAQVISKPTTVSVTARATDNGDANFTWSANCSSGGQSKTTSGGTTAMTPATVTLTLPFASPDSCTVSATVTLSTKDSTNTLNVDLLFTGTGASPSPSPSSSPTPTPAPVREFQGYHGMCLDAAGNGSADRTKIIIWTCNSHDQAQSWAYRNGQLIHNGKCANDQRSGGNGSKVILYTCNGQPNEIWTHLANGELKLKANGGKYCLDDPQSSTRNGTQVIVYSCKSSANQRWYQP
jgi:hypothetical protein